LFLLLLKSKLQTGGGGLGFIAWKRSTWWTSVDCVNKENGEKVAVNFFIIVPYLSLFNLQRKRVTKLATLRATLSGKRNCGVVQRLDNLDRITVQRWKEKLDL